MPLGAIFFVLSINTVHPFGSDGLTSSLPLKIWKVSIVFASELTTLIMYATCHYISIGYINLHQNFAIQMIHSQTFRHRISAQPYQVIMHPASIPTPHPIQVSGFVVTAIALPMITVSPNRAIAQPVNISCVLFKIVAPLSPVFPTSLALRLAAFLLGCVRTPASSDRHLT